MNYDRTFCANSVQCPRKKDCLRDIERLIGLDLVVSQSNFYTTDEDAKDCVYFVPVER